MLAIKYCKNSLKNDFIDRADSILVKKQTAYKQFRISPEQITKLTEFQLSLKDHQLPGLLCFSTMTKLQLLKTHLKLEKKFNQYRCIDGTQNVWVIKPSYSSRGLGISLTNRMKDIIVEGRKNQSKIVQKYVESPFLINNKKFDLRQWVLVTSWEPLDVYVFDTAYLRLCCKDFNLSNMQDIYVHLSNYSIQRRCSSANPNQKQENPNVMSIEEFVEYLNYPNMWTDEMFPKLQSIIFRALKSIQDTQDADHKCRCFEVYGFDIMFDSQLNPWILEINLSPACNEKRAPYLKQMLNDMAFDLVNYLERRILTSQMPEENSVELTTSLRHKRNAYNKMKDFFEGHAFLNTDEFY